MDAIEFLLRYYNLQKSIMFDELHDLGFATVTYCSGDNTGFWNQALVDDPLTGEEVEEIEKKMQSLKRVPTIYFVRNERNTDLIKKLEEFGYGEEFEDSWMFHSGEGIEDSGFDKIRKVESSDDLEVFLDVFDRCYQKGDPQNAYGELGDYLEVAERVWNDFNSSDEVQYFLAYDGNTPVAVSTLTSRQGIGYISNVGSLCDVRGKGFGKMVTMYCVILSVKADNKEHCLATEEGTYANEFYKRIGFETRFTAVAFTKE